MDIRIGSHALLRSEERGVSEEEIKNVLQTGIEITAKSGRLSKEKIFPLEQVVNKKYYKEKKVTVIYIIENNVLTVITVIAKYGTFTDSFN